MPRWSDLCPSHIAQQLPLVWAYSYDHATDTFTGKLAGYRIASLYDKPFHHTPMADLYSETDFQFLFTRAKRVILGPEIYHGEGPILPRLHRFRFGERLMLPFIGDEGLPAGVFGCTEYYSIDAPDDPELRETDEWYPLAPPSVAH
jgi:hypothetical protein